MEKDQSGLDFHTIQMGQFQKDPVFQYKKWSHTNIRRKYG